MSSERYLKNKKYILAYHKRNPKKIKELNRKRYHTNEEFRLRRLAQMKEYRDKKRQERL